MKTEKMKTSDRPRGCLTNDELSVFLDGANTPAVETHLDDCRACRRLVSALAAADTTGSATDAELHATALISQFGRFELTRLLGEGAMGQVWAARDPQLDRDIAIKVMAHSARQLGAEGKERMRREAQAMARLNHPNVVAIYEFGVVDEQVFCAMEIVEGMSWRTWLEEARDWRQILDIAILAARGLRATHEAGLLHRDIKPDNILIADDGRVLLGDFGLAKLRAASPTASHQTEGSPRTLDLDRDLETLTGTGELLGTPAYMSPESISGEIIDERSDQFSFCVTLFEALTGGRPFQGKSLGALLIAMSTTPEWPRRSRHIPPMLRRTILRGLASDPQERFGSMDELIKALEITSGTARRRRRRTAMALSAGALIGLAILALILRPRSSLQSVSKTARTQIRKAWNEERRAAVRKAILAVGIDGADQELAKVEEFFDSYSLDWLNARLDAWKATHERKEQSPLLLERRLACYDRLALGVAALARMFEQVESEREVGKAMQASRNMRSIASCADPLKVGYPDNDLDDPRVDELERRLAAIELLAIDRSSEEARLAATALVEDTKQLDVPALRARALFELARFQAESPEPGSAVNTYWETILNAANARDHALVARSYFYLIRLLGLTMTQSEEALALEPVARAAIEQSGGDPSYHGMLDSILGDIHLGNQDLVQAERHMRSALDAFTLSKGKNNQQQMSLLNDLAGILALKGQIEEAMEMLERALVLSRNIEGADPISTGILLQKLSIFARQRHDWEKVERFTSEAIEIFASRLGADDARTWGARALHAQGLAGRGDSDQAETELRAAARALREVMPEDSTLPVTTALLLAELLEEEGKVAEAGIIAKQCVADLEKLEPAPSVDRAESLRVLARITAHTSPRKASSLYGEALLLRSKLEGYDVAGTTEILDELSVLALRLGRPGLALPWFKRLPDAGNPLASRRAELEQASAARHR